MLTQSGRSAFADNGRGRAGGRVGAPRPVSALLPHLRLCPARHSGGKRQRSGSEKRRRSSISDFFRGRLAAPRLPLFSFPATWLKQGRSAGHGRHLHWGAPLAGAACSARQPNARRREDRAREISKTALWLSSVSLLLQPSSASRLAPFHAHAPLFAAMSSRTGMRRTGSTTRKPLRAANSESSTAAAEKAAEKKAAASSTTTSAKAMHKDMRG